MAAGPMWDLSDEYVVAVTKLPIYNFGVAFAAVSKLHASEIKIWESLRANPLEKADETRATQLYKEAESAIKYSLEALD
ncbi:hypothetical protein BST17_25645 [Mycolicibacterium bacteremicum]|uniref:Uncharacterized protein n=2 Tax=Mycolicibacterium bacteremicum TaxID=564198 RepID=A0A1W9YPK9_MYCBA|nr:hypothetical protein BST17_25645 [Mycolicibacterium bacteremicum]